MENENEFLKELNKGDESMFESEDGKIFGEDNLFPGEQSKETVENENGDEGKPLPFHKDPKVQRYIQKELEKKLESYKQPTTEVQKFLDSEPENDELSSVLERIIGNDTPEKVAAVKDFKKVLNSLEEKGAQKALSKLAEQKEAEKQEEARASQQLQEGFDSIEDTFNVDITSNTPLAKKTKNEFLEFVKKVSTKDADGNILALPDLVSTFDVFQQTRTKPDNSRAKQLASRSITRSTEVPQPAQAKDSSWRGVEKFLQSLSN